jgi:hypothetical protein
VGAGDFLQQESADLYLFLFVARAIGGICYAWVPPFGTFPSWLLFHRGPTDQQAHQWCYITRGLLLPIL